MSLNTEGFGTQRTDYYVAVGDLNNDGNQDMAVLTEGSIPAVALFLGRGDGTFRAGSVYNIATRAPDSIALADLNNDGNLDLIMGDGDTGLIIMLGNGDGTFQPFAEYPFRINSLKLPQEILIATAKLT